MLPRGKDLERGKKRGAPSLGNRRETLEAGIEGLEKVSSLEVEDGT